MEPRLLDGPLSRTMTNKHFVCFRGLPGFSPRGRSVSALDRSFLRLLTGNRQQHLTLTFDPLAAFLGGTRRRALAFRFEALAQRVHQIDDVGRRALFRLRSEERRVGKE